MQEVTSYNDLGVMVTSDLLWSQHISTITKKANCTVHIFKKVFNNLNPTMWAKLYKLYVRPVVEYCSSVWHPSLVRDKTALESVQRRITRIPFGVRRPSYEQRLALLDLPSIEERKNRGDLIMTFRILTESFTVNLNHLYSLRNDDRLRGHRYKLQRETFKSVPRQIFLSNRVFYLWNELPDSVFEVTSLNNFKNRLDSL